METKETESEKRDVGLHNWRNLFKKPTLQDWIILIMLIAVLIMAWSYKYEIGMCQQAWVNKTVSCELCQQGMLYEINDGVIMNLDLKNISFNYSNISENG